MRRLTAPGAMPGSLAITPNWPKPVIQVMAYGEESLQGRTIENVADLDQFIGKFPVTWVHVAGMGDEVKLRQLADRFQIHPLALEDVVNVHQRAKLEEYGDTLFIVTRMVSPEHRDRTSQLSMFLGENYLLTFAEEASDPLDPVRQRLRTGQSQFRDTRSDYLMYAILDAVIDEYFPAVEECGQMLDLLDQEAWSQVQPDTMSHLHEIRNELLLFHRSLWPQRDLVQLMLRRSHAHVSDNTRLYLRDCHDHLLQLNDLLDVYREICNDLRDFCLSQVSQRMNEIMKVLTIIATIFMPLSFFAGLWGMNFNPRASAWNMPELDWTYGYPFALALMAISACSMLIFFWRRGWLGANSRMRLTIDQASNHRGDSPDKQGSRPES